MTDLKKKRIKTIMKYTWPFYIVAAVLITFGLQFAFNVAHRTPAYKTLILFISGDIKTSEEQDGDKLMKADILAKFQDNELKSVSSIYANPNGNNYYSQISGPGFNLADVLIIPKSMLDKLNVKSFALDITEEMYKSYYQDYATYDYEKISYGIELDKEKTKDYFTLPDETCYMCLNAGSKNTGKYSSDAIEEHDNALQLVKDWGK